MTTPNERVAEEHEQNPFKPAEPPLSEADREKDQPIEDRAVDSTGAGIQITKQPADKRVAL